MSFEGASSGKVILLGEHAVVHGVPALAVSIGAGAWASVRPTLDVARLSVRDADRMWTIESSSELFRAFRVLSEAIGVTVDAQARIDIPTRAGLGSSACLGVALARAMLSTRNTPFESAQLIDAATSWERVFHGNPSGIDVAVATFGGCIEFQKSAGVTKLDLASPIPLCVGDTGLRSSTRAMVEHVARELSSQSDQGKTLLNGVASCVNRARAALTAGDWDRVGSAMNDNQALLCELGLSNSQTDALCASARKAGARAAKITGAGGGGCVIALAPDCQQAVLNAWRKEGFSGFAVNAGTHGRQ